MAKKADKQTSGQEDKRTVNFTQLFIPDPLIVFEMLLIM